MPSRTAASGIVALAALAGVASGVPTVWSPLNLVGLVPALLASAILSGAAIAVPPILLGGVFAWWCPNVWAGQTRVSPWSLALAVCVGLLNLASVTLGRHYGLEYQGVAYVNAVTFISVALWVTVCAGLLWAARGPSPARSLWAHLGLFVWLGWYAIPYMGELP